MKITLISPSLKDVRNTGKSFHLPQIALALLAKMTPPDIDVSIVDEIIQPLDFDSKIDLVGITVNSKTVVRSYEIADEFRRRDVPVVLGGIHPTVACQEAIKHADAVVIGEAEGIWEKLLEDFKKGSLQKLYKNHTYPNLQNQPIPVRDLFDKNKYITVNMIQTSRGCPYACTFCVVSSMYGKGVRLRPVNDVINEVKTLKGNEVFFVDDNIFWRKDYTKELFTKLIPLKKKWVSQASVTITNDKETLKLFSKSGCQGLLLGFETPFIDSLKEAGKFQNVKNDYIETINKLHDHGMSVVGTFVVGFDSQGKDCFEKLLDFILKSKIDVVEVNILMPYPGTALYKKMKKEGRLIDDAWWLKFEANDVVFKPKLMTREELYQGWIWTIKELYKICPMLKRWGIGVTRRSLFGNSTILSVNLGFRKNAYALPEESINPMDAP